MIGGGAEPSTERTLGPRGQTAVLGFVFIVVLVAVVSIGVLFVAGQTTSEIERQAERERVEGAFIELSTELETASSSEDVARAMEVELHEYREDLTFAETGEISVTVDGETMYTSPIGSIEYVAVDETKIVYQAGGIWRDTGDGVHTVSRPNVHVRDGTVSLPVVILDGEGLTDGPLSMNTVSTRSVHSSHVGEDVVVNVTTRYHEWWASHFRTKLGDDAVSVTDTGSPAETVSIRLEGSDDRSSGFDLDHGITVNHHLDTASGASGPTIASDTVAERLTCATGGGTYTGAREVVACDRLESGYDASLDDVPWFSADDEIDRQFERANGPEGTSLGAVHLKQTESMTLSAGVYYASRVEIDNELTIDLGDGDVTLVVGPAGISGSNPDYGNSISVENVTDDNTFRIYNKGDFPMNAQWDVCADGCDGDHATAIEYYARSDTDLEIADENTVFEGVIVAPESDVRIHAASVYGAIVAENAEITGPKTYIEYDDAIAEKDFFFTESNESSDRESYYLNVVINEITVTNE